MPETSGPGAGSESEMCVSLQNKHREPQKDDSPRRDSSKNAPVFWLIWGVTDGNHFKQRPLLAQLEEYRVVSQEFLWNQS